MNTSFEQLSLFSISSSTPLEADAVSCMDNFPSKVLPAEPWMKALVPEGEYSILVAGHPLVLRPARIRPESIPEGHEFYHYLIDGRLYSGIFVGRDSE